ncbi:MAG: DUF3298 domain-containing protein [Verrucomicrobiales bacterium]|nr:DUF3298 domain-containing protein [Verrucomicrobiales bacterium]
MNPKQSPLKRLLSLALASGALVPGVSFLRAADLADFEIYPDDAMLYRAFTGSLGGRIPVRVFLCRVDGEWEGSYFYTDRRLPLRLTQTRGTGETRDSGDRGTIVLRETPMIGPEGGTGRWEGAFDDEARTFTGTWHSPDGNKSLPIDLRESGEDESLPATFYRFSSAWTQARGSFETRKENSVVVVQFDSEKAAAQRINATIRAAATHFFVTGGFLDADTEPQSPEIAIPKDGNPFAALELAIRAEPIAPEDLEIGLSGSDITELTIQPVHNEGGYVAVRFHLRTYQGGAHGNYFDHHLTFETATGRLLDLRRDILKPGFEEPLARAAEAQWRRNAGLAADAPLSGGPLDTYRIELSESWFLTSGGIGFSHEPYELASFAEGFVVYVLPWEVMKPWLRVGALGR